MTEFVLDNLILVVEYLITHEALTFCVQNYDMQHLTMWIAVIGKAVLYLPFGPRFFFEGMVLLSF